MNIVFEGLPGAGKSTLISAIKEKENGIIVGEFCEGVSGVFGDIDYFINNEKKKNEIMQANLNREICYVDRFWQSTLIFNAVSCGVRTKKELRDLYKIIYKGYDFVDYIYVFLDIPSSVSLQRNVNTIEAQQCMWFNETFNRKAYDMYHLFYENIEYVLNKKVFKLLIDTQHCNVADEVKYIGKILAKDDFR